MSTVTRTGMYLPLIPRSIRDLNLATFLPDEEEDTMAHLKEFPKREQQEFIIECGVYYAQAIAYKQEQLFLHAVYSRFFWQFPVELSPYASNNASTVKLRIQNQLERVKDFMGDYKPRNEWETAFAVPRDHTKAFARFHIYRWLKQQAKTDEETMDAEKSRSVTPLTQWNELVVDENDVSGSGSDGETTDSSADANAGTMDEDMKVQTDEEEDAQSDEDEDAEGDEDEDAEGEDDETISDSDGESEMELIHFSPGHSKDYPVDLTHLSDD